jgi:hypothetical protein
MLGFAIRCFLALSFLFSALLGDLSLRGLAYKHLEVYELNTSLGNKIEEAFRKTSECFLE